MRYQVTMVHYLRVLLAILLLVCLSSASKAVDTSRVYSIANPSGSATTIQAISVADTEHFAVELLRPLPYTVAENGTIDFRVIVKSRDGITHTTQVLFNSESKVSSYTIVLTSPYEQNGVQVAQPPHSKPAYPNPVKDNCIIDVDIRLYPNVQVDVINDVGGRVIGVVQPAGDKLILDSHTLANGNYHVVVFSGGTIVRKEEIIVRH